MPEIVLSTVDTERILENEEENKNATNSEVNEQMLPKMIMPRDNWSSNDDSSITLSLLRMSIPEDSSNEDTSDKETCYTCELPLPLSARTLASLCDSNISSNVKPNQAHHAKDEEISATNGTMPHLVLRDETTVTNPENVAETGAMDN